MSAWSSRRRPGSDLYQGDLLMVPFGPGGAMTSGLFCCCWLFHRLASMTGTVFHRTTRLQGSDAVVRLLQPRRQRLFGVEVWRSALHLGRRGIACPLTETRRSWQKTFVIFILYWAMITIAWKNKGTTHGLACLGNVKTPRKRTGKHTTAAATRPPTHTGYTFHCLPIFLFTLLAYRPARRVSLSNSSCLTSIPKLHTAALDAAGICPCATVLKAQQTMAD